MIFFSITQQRKFHGYFEMNLKKQMKTEKKEKNLNHLSNFIIFNIQENKFQIDYQKILKNRDLLSHAKQH